MSYKTKADRERENWMTLPQAISHIELFENFSNSEARAELLNTLEKGAFHSSRRSLVRWRDKFRALGEPPNEIGPPDVPPRGQRWATVDIRWETGEVLDPYGAVENGKWLSTWRVVWLARSKVMELWPERPASHARTDTGTSESNVVSLKGRKTGPKTNKLQSIVDDMKAELASNSLTIEQLRTMSDDKLVSKYGDKFDSGRTTCRDARDRVVTEFDGNSNPVK